MKKDILIIRIPEEEYNPEQQSELVQKLINEHKEEFYLIIVFVADASEIVFELMPR